MYRLAYNLLCKYSILHAFPLALFNDKSEIVSFVAYIMLMICCVTLFDLLSCWIALGVRNALKNLWPVLHFRSELRACVQGMLSLYTVTIFSSMPVSGSPNVAFAVVTRIQINSLASRCLECMLCGMVWGKRRSGKLSLRGLAHCSFASSQ